MNTQDNELTKLIADAVGLPEYDAAVEVVIALVAEACAKEAEDTRNASRESIAAAIRTKFLVTPAATTAGDGA